MASWKKIIVSGSDAHLNSVTASVFGGNVSGSSTSTGSFGNLFTDNNAEVQGQLFIQPQNNTNSATTAEELVIYGASSEAKIAIVANADANSFYTSRIVSRYDGVEGFYIQGPSSDKFLSYGHSGTNTRIGVSDTAGTLHLRAKTISGSAVSTGSFGHLMVGGGTITALNNQGANRLTTIGSTTTELDGEANLTFDGSTLDVTGDIVVSGDLTINGSTTTLAATNLEIADAFGFFATGSAGANVDAGIIVQSGSYVDSGSSIYHDISSERWSVAKGVGSSEVSVSDTQWQGFVATVYTASASPVGNLPKYGVGEIHIDDDGEIYIYS